MLSCSRSLTCVNSGNGVGCCFNTFDPCPNIYTTCLNYGETCGSSCQLDDSIQKCSDTDYPYCGTYYFEGNTRLFNCDSTSAESVSSVELLRDFYMTELSSTLGAATEKFPYTLDVAASSSATPTFSSSPSSGDDDDGGGNGLSTGTIRGIAIGVSVGVFLIFCAIAFFIVHKRRQRRRKAASQPNLPPAYSPPMQQPGPQPYQPVPQSDPGAGYFTPNDVSKTGAVAESKPATSPADPRFSPANSTHLSPPVGGPQMQSTAGGNTPMDYYRGPASPTVTEVDGIETQRPLSGVSANASMAPERHYTPYSPSISTMGPGQSQFGEGSYVAPHGNAQEVEPRPAFTGPYEMSHDRH